MLKMYENNMAILLRVNTLPTGPRSTGCFVDNNSQYIPIQLISTWVVTYCFTRNIVIMTTHTKLIDSSGVSDFHLLNFVVTT